MSWLSWYDCDPQSPDMRACDDSAQSLARQAGDIFITIQEPCDSVRAWLQARVKDLRGDVNRACKAVSGQAGDLLTRLLAAVDAAAVGMVGSVSSLVGLLYRDVLASGQTGPELPDCLGLALSGFAVPSSGEPVPRGLDPLTGMPVVSMGGSPRLPVGSPPPQSSSPSPLSAEGADAFSPSAVDSSAVNGNIPGAGSTLSPAVGPVVDVPHGTSQPTVIEPHDWTDQPHVYLFADQSQTWHRRVRQFYGNALDAILAAPTIKEAVDARDTPAGGAVPLPRHIPDIP